MPTTVLRALTPGLLDLATALQRHNNHKKITNRQEIGSFKSCNLNQKRRIQWILLALSESLLFVPGQKDNGTSYKSCHGTGRDVILTVCPVPPGTSYET